MGLFSSIAGAVAGPLIGKVLGGGKSKAQPTQQQQQHPGSFFQPFTFKSGLGDVTATSEGDYGFNIESSLDPRLTALQDTSIGGLGGLLGQYTKSIDFDPRVLDFEYSPYDAAQEYYDRGLGVLNPQFEAQRTKLASDLFGSGRLGLNLAQSSQGAGEDARGFVNPDAYGLLSAQNQTLANLWGQSLDKGRAMEMERFKIADALDQARRAQTQDYLGGVQSLWDIGTGVGDIEMALRQQALNEEVARSNTYKGNATTMQWQETPESKFGSTLGGLVGKGVSDWLGAPTTTTTYNPYSGWHGGAGSTVDYMDVDGFQIGF